MRIVNKQLRKTTNDLAVRFTKRILLLSSRISTEVFKLSFIETSRGISLRVDLNKKNLTGEEYHFINEIFKTFPFDKETNCPSDNE